MIEYGTNQGIYYAIREGYVSGARVKELHCRRRYGTYNQFAINLGALRYPLCSRKKEKKFVNSITAAYAEVWDTKPPKQNTKTRLN